MSPLRLGLVAAAAAGAALLLSAPSTLAIPIPAGEEGNENGDANVAVSFGWLVACLDLMEDARMEALAAPEGFQFATLEEDIRGQYDAEPLIRDTPDFVPYQFVYSNIPDQAEDWPESVLAIHPFVPEGFPPVTLGELAQNTGDQVRLRWWETTLNHQGDGVVFFVHNYVNITEFDEDGEKALQADTPATSDFSANIDTPLRRDYVAQNIVLDGEQFIQVCNIQAGPNEFGLPDSTDAAVDALDSAAINDAPTPSLSPELLVGRWDCTSNGLSTTDVLSNLEQAGGIEALGDAGSAEWAAVLAASSESFVSPDLDNPKIFPAFKWLDGAKTEAFFLASFGSDVKIGSVSLTAAGDYVIQAVNANSGGLASYELIDKDTLHQTFVRAGTLTADGEPAFSEVPGQTPSVALAQCTRRS